MGSIVGSLTGENSSVVGTLDVSGVVTAPAGVVANLTGNTTGTHNGDVAGATTVTASGAVTGGTFNNYQLLTGTADPSAGGGVAATQPALYMRTGTDQIWLNNGAGDTAWTRLATAVDTALLAPIASPTFTGTATLPTAAITTLNIAGIETWAATSPTIFSANQTDFSGSGSTMVSRWSSDASRNVYSRTGSSHQAQVVMNVGAQNIVIVHDDGATGTAALRFKLRGATNFTLVPDAAVLMYYDAVTARWRLMEL